MSSPRQISTILFDANSLMGQRTGVGHYTAGLIESLAANLPDTQFIGYYYNFLGRKKPPATPAANNITYRPILAFPGPIVNLLRRLRIEVPIEILTGTWSADFILYPNFLSQPSLRRTPSAPIIHDMVYYDHPEYGSNKSVRDLTRFVPKTIARSSFIITVSEESRQRIADVYHIAADTILTTFIPPAAVLRVEDSAALVAKQGITKPYLLFIGTLEPRKNIIGLLEAYTLLPEAIRSTYSLVLAGKIDWKYQETKAKLERLQDDGYDIHYLGYVDDELRAALYQQARLFVMAPHYEGFGMQTLEALQYGTPCAISDIAVLREAGGDMVDYFDKDDHQDIARVITASLSKPAPPADKLQTYVLSLPSWSQVANVVARKIKASLKN